jgi:hypothetical protein
MHGDGVTRFGCAGYRVTMREKEQRDDARPEESTVTVVQFAPATKGVRTDQLVSPRH